MGPAILAQAMEDRRLRVVDRLVMWFMTRYLLDWIEFREIRITELAPTLGVEDQTAGRAVRALVACGYLEPAPLGRRLRAYRLYPHRQQHETAPMIRGVAAEPAEIPLVSGCVPRVVEQTLDDTQLRPVQRLAMWYLARHFLDFREYRPVKIVALASAMAIEEQTAARGLRALSAAGYLDARQTPPDRVRAYRMPWTRRQVARAA